MLELIEVQKNFGAITVLNVSRQTFHPGITWLKGANGSGKSTLFRIIAGMLPFKGSIIINQDIRLVDNPVEYRLLVNHAEAEPVYPSFLSGDELIAFVMKVKKGSETQVTGIKAMLGISGYTANPCGSYSSGMLKKLALLLAFLGSPSWILLDEPLTTLDHDAQEGLCEMIMKWNREKKINFLISSHQDIQEKRISFSAVYTMKDQNIHETALAND